MRKLEKTVLVSQINVFLQWCERSGISASNYEEYLWEFKDYTSRTDALDITKTDLERYLAHIHESSGGVTYRVISARKAIQQLMKFYTARSKNGRKRLGAGRPPKLDDAKAVFDYRGLRDKRGEPVLSFAQIGRIMGKDKGRIWNLYKMAKSAFR